jgi:hypothetical protein
MILYVAQKGTMLTVPACKFEDRVLLHRYMVDFYWILVPARNVNSDEKIHKTDGKFHPNKIQNDK